MWKRFADRLDVISLLESFYTTCGPARNCEIDTYIGFGLPAFVLMVILSATYNGAHSLPLCLSVFTGLQLIVVAIVAKAAFAFGRTTVKGWRDCVIGLAATCYLVLGGNPILGIVAGALA